ncbi:MAG: helix-turn-helix domain-containing protein [Armatimonadota bacterium]
MLKVKEAAELVRMSERALYEAIRRGEFPGQKVRGAWRVPKQLLAQWLSGEWQSERKAA